MWTAAVYAQDNGVPVKLAADLWCPFTCASSASQQGFLVDVARLALPGRVKNYEVAGWSRVLQMQSAAPAPVLIVLGVGNSEQNRQRFVLSRKPVLFSPMCFYRLKGSAAPFKGVVSLKDLRVGITQGYQFEDSAMSEFVKTASRRHLNMLTGADASVRHVQMLLRKRSDVVVEDRTVMRWSMNQQPGASEAIEEAACLEERDPGVYVGVPRSDPRAPTVIQDFDVAFDALTRRGQLAALRKFYGLEPVSGPREQR